MKYLIFTISLITSFSYAVCTANVDMGSNLIKNLASPISNSDAVNKLYVDTTSSTLQSSITNLTTDVNQNSSDITDLNNSINNIDANKWDSDTGNSLIKLTNLSDGTTSRDTDGINTFVIKDSGKVGLGTNQPQASLHINNTDAIIIPVGSTVQRPATPSVGMIRLNSTTSLFEGYTGSAWVELSN